MAMRKKNEAPRKFENFKRLLMLFLMSCSAQSFGAGFDCTKAKVPAEKLICTSAVLSRLDEELSARYKTAVSTVGAASHIVTGQRKWIDETRNRCADEACLSEVYKARIAWLKDSSVGNAATCGVGEGKIIGNWKRLKNGDFEEFVVEIEGGKRNFSSWLHHRPEFMGQWELKNCILHIENGERPSIDFDYQVLGLRGEVLYLKNTEDGGQSSYRRTGK